MRSDRIDTFDDVPHPELEVSKRDGRIALVVTGEGVSNTSMQRRKYSLTPEQAAALARDLAAAAKPTTRPGRAR